ncbi:1531_t:CDS:2 [Ambispora gerdemannii]|uniref:1531_t:CDS:1 n=1 Tax=Ambispora gerdemannii TaxID=144530 RepID=A0A9N9C7L5_9GLOM|nr:1531_t:CDS:2 [Ambispora gerdemannii]
MGKSTKFYKRQTRKERKLKSLTAEALISSSSSSVSPPKPTTKFKKSSSKQSTLTLSSGAIASIKKHRDEFLKGSDKIKPKNNHDDRDKQEQMDVDDNKGNQDGKKKKERRKTNEGRPDYVDIFSGKKTFKKIQE